MAAATTETACDDVRNYTATDFADIFRRLPRDTAAVRNALRVSAEFEIG